MTKDQWLIMRDREEIPLVIFFEYYKEKGGVVTDFQSFSEIFMVIQGKTFTQNNVQKGINFNTCIFNLNNFYNQKFDLM